MTKRSCHETLLHISLYGSHIYNRYYHQDLHHRQVDAGSPPTLLPYPRALLLTDTSASVNITAHALRLWSYIGVRLERH